jgi:Tol biopolymer transport system component
MAVDLRVPSHVRLSPDGAFVAFAVAPIGHREKDPTTTLFVAGSDGRTPPHALTGFEHNHVMPRWSPDGASLAFLADRAKRGELQLHVVPATGGEPLRLTSLQGGVDQPSWRPDGRAITFTARRRALAGESEPERDIKVASDRWRPKAIASVPPTGGVPVIVGPAEGHVWAFAYSPDGSKIAALVTETEDHPALRFPGRAIMVGGRSPDCADRRPAPRRPPQQGHRHRCRVLRGDDAR